MPNYILKNRPFLPRACGGVLAAAFLAAWLLLCPRSSAADELRGWWVDAWHAGFLNQSQVDTLLGVPGTGAKGTIRDANCNAVFVQVRRRADVCYPSGVGEPYFSSGLSPATFNALQAIINAAHDTTGGKQRIAVHAWIVTFATSASGVSPPPSSIYWQHSDPDDPDSYWMTLNDSGEETGDKAFDPGHPKCEQYLTDVCMDLVTNFDIDGLHFDYIRFTGSNQGYNPTSIARYNARFGLSGQPLSSSEQFKQWRRDQITSFVRKVYANIQYVKPQVQLSVAGVTWNPSPTSTTRSAFKNTRPYYDVYSDWDAWVTEGIVDMAVPMNYYNWASLPSDYTRWTNFIKDAPDRGSRRHMINGPGVYLNSQANAIGEILMCRTPSPAGNTLQGWCGYSYNQPYSGGTWSSFSPALVSEVTPTPAEIPAMPWKTSPTRGHLMGTVTYVGSGQWADGALVTISGPVSNTQYCDGTGFYAFIDLPPGTYTVTAEREGYPAGEAELIVVPGQMTRQDFVLGGGLGPIILNVAADGIGEAEATIIWTTDKASSSQVEYGLTTAYGSVSELDTSLVTMHIVELSGLQPNTLYHYRVISASADGSTTSGDHTFTTSGPPLISSVRVSGIKAVSAVVSWATNTPAGSTVFYGTTGAYGSQAGSSEPVTSHRVELTGLTPDTTYHFQVASANAFGTAASEEFTFHTSGSPKISAVLATGIGSSSATVQWQTDVPADSLVEYGLTQSYGSSSPLDEVDVTAHTVSLSGLQANTTYHYRVRSANEAGTTYSDDYTFTTTIFVGEVMVDATDGVGFTFVSGAWVLGARSGHIGTDYCWAFGVAGEEEADATHRVRWTPALPLNGPYDVYIYYASGSNRSPNSYWRVVGSSSVATRRVDQTVSGGSWVLLASDVQFAAGTDGYVELCNNIGSASRIVHADAVKFVFKGGDATPPTVPGGLDAAAVSPTSIELTWDASLDDTGVAGYKIIRNGTQIGTSPTNRFTDETGLLPNTVYSYRVSAYDAAGNDSGLCPAVWRATLSVPPGPDTVTCTRAADAWHAASDFTFTAVGGFGAGRVSRYVWAWDTNPIHIWGSGDEDDWTGGDLKLTAPASGEYYLHLRGYNSEGVASGAAHLGPYGYDPTPPAMLSVTADPYSTSITSLNASWSAADLESGIREYEYSVGTQPGEADAKQWTTAGAAQSALITGVFLEDGETYYVNVRAVNGAGSVSGVLSSGGTTIAQAASSAGEARGFPDGTLVAIEGQTVTAAFDGFFYIGDRSSGLRVVSGEAVTVNRSVTVIGTLALVNGCERALELAHMVVGDDTDGVIAASMVQRSLGGGAQNAYTPGVTGGAGVNNIGLLVRVAGRVTALTEDGFYLEDGSGLKDAPGNTGVRVWVGSGALPEAGAFIQVTGISSCRASGSAVVPLVLARSISIL
jgi:uncharacterized lipoprotein YddW (UPF0748 family)